MNYTQTFAVPQEHDYSRTAYSDPSNSGTGLDEPMLIVLSYGKGRIFHSAYGHDAFALSSVDDVVTFQRGVDVGGNREGNAKGADDVSYRQHRQLSSGSCSD